MRHIQAIELTVILNGMQVIAMRGSICLSKALLLSIAEASEAFCLKFMPEGGMCNTT